MREISDGKITGNKFLFPCFSQKNLILRFMMATQEHEQAFQSFFSEKLTPNFINISVGSLTVKSTSKSLWTEVVIY